MKSGSSFVSSGMKMNLIGEAGSPACSVTSTVDPFVRVPVQLSVPLLVRVLSPMSLYFLDYLSLSEGWEGVVIDR